MFQSPEEGMIELGRFRTWMFRLVDVVFPSTAVLRKSSRTHRTPKLVHVVDNRTQKHKWDAFLNSFIASKLLTIGQFSQGKTSTTYLLLPVGSLAEPDRGEWVLIHSVKFSWGPIMGWTLSWNLGNNREEHAVICLIDYWPIHSLTFPNSAANSISQASLPTGFWLGWNQWE